MELSLCDKIDEYSYTVEPPNKGHFGNNIINSAVLSLIERFSSSQWFSMDRKYKEWQFLGSQTVSPIERTNIQYPFLRGSFIRGSTVPLITGKCTFF